MNNLFRYIYNYAEIIKLIVNLTKKNAPFIRDECQNAFDTGCNLK